MENDSLLIIKDTVEIFDTVQFQVIDNLVLSDAVNSLIENSNKNESYNMYIIPAIGVAIAFWALIVSYRALKLNQKHNFLSVEPLLVFRPSTSHRQGKIALRIYNKGIGPLTFTSFIMTYDNQEFTRCSDIFKFIRKKFNYTDNDFDLQERLFSLPLKEYSLTTSEKKTLIKYRLKKSEKESRAFYDEFKKVEFKYTYKDLYKREFSDTFNYGEYY